MVSRLYYLLNGDWLPTFQESEQNGAVLVNSVPASPGPKRIIKTIQASPKLQNLLMRLLEKNPKDRLGAISSE